MKLLLQILLTLGLLAMLVGTYLAFSGKMLILSPGGFWRGGIALWMFLIAIKMVYSDQK
jgi:hypothetical protein